MAKTQTPQPEIIRGKLNSKDKDVWRVRDKKQQHYTPKRNTAPASPKQQAHRSKHGKISTILNPLMADPAQREQLHRERLEYNHLIELGIIKSGKRYTTDRSYGYYIISKQLDEQEPQKQPRVTAKTALPRGYRLYIKPFADLSAVELYEILKSRFSVFVLEQGIRYLDEDNIDLTATHLALHRKGQVVAYARLYVDSGDNQLIINSRGVSVPQPRVFRAGRMLTTERGKGYGRIIILHLMAEAKRQGAEILRIHAQLDAASFYRHFRFAKVGEPFMEAGIEHIVMERKLTRSAAKE